MLSVRPTLAVFGRWPILGFVAVVLAFAALQYGPRLGDHEVIVAQTARQMLQSGDWLVPTYLDTPFLVKPPLAYWMVAAASALPGSALPVTDFTARLPSVIASLLTTIVLFFLARSMFGRRTALTAVFVHVTCVGTMLYAVNATVEATLTFFCTWAMAEMWWATQAVTAGRRRVHLIRYYIALGLGMLAKGPMPLVTVAVPIALWWWLGRPARLIGARGLRAGRLSAALFVRTASKRLRRALGSLGLLWGLPLFLLIVLPWMVLVARSHPYAWDLWEYEYLNRWEGDYPGSRPGRWFYYVPVLAGLAVPWCLSLPEALAAPFRGRFRHVQRPLVFAWFWVVTSLVVVSLMNFKKPYYILPALPGCVLLLAPVLDQLFRATGALALGRVKALVFAIVAAVAAGVGIAWGVAAAKYDFLFDQHGAVGWAMAASLVIVAGVVCAGLCFVWNQRWRSFGAIGGTAIATFLVIWCGMAAHLDNQQDELALSEALDAHNVPHLYWLDNRPDGRLVYYDHHAVRQVLDPYRLIADADVTPTREAMREAVADHLQVLFERDTPTYAIMRRQQLEEFIRCTELDAHEVFHIECGDPNSAADDWVVITNRRTRAITSAANPSSMG